MSWPAVVLASAAAIDVSGSCQDVQERLRDWNAREKCLADDAWIVVSVERLEPGQRLRVELAGTASESATVDRVVNSCDEVFNAVKFELELGCVDPTPIVPPVTSTRLGLEAFSVTSSNYPDWYGFGAGGGISLAFDELRVGAYGAWMQPALLQSSDPSVARYDLHRLDLQVLSCLSVRAEPVQLSPCLGANLSWFRVPPEQLSGQFDRDGGALGVDLGFAVSKPVLEKAALKAALLLRYAAIPFETDTLKVGEFWPRTFELNLRLGFTFDMFNFNQAGDSRLQEGSVASQKGIQPW